MDDNARVYAEPVIATVITLAVDGGSQDVEVRLDRWQIPDGRTLICSRGGREVARFAHGEWGGISAFGRRIQE